MIVEVERFVEFKDDWYKPGGKVRESMVFEPMTINTEYVATIRREPVTGGFDFTLVSMADHGAAFIIAKTYEEMRELVNAGNLVSYPLPAMGGYGHAT